MHNTKLIICGSIAIDRIMKFSGHYKDLIEPASLHVLSVSVLVDYSDVAPGGIGANIASNVAQMGEKPVLLGAVGNDAADYMKQLAGQGIDTSNVHISNLPTASFNVLTDSDGNQVGGFYPGAMGDIDSLTVAPWAEQDALVWLAPYDPVGMRRLVEESRQHKLRLAYDPGQQVSNVSGADLKAGVEAAEIVILNEYELAVLTSKSGLSVADIRAMVPLFITTYGKEGSEISGTKIGEPIRLGIAKAAEMVDPTGAGDAYRSGFLHGYLQQWEARKSGQLGAVVASFVLEQHGPQVKLDREAIVQRYKETFNEEIEL